jgi:phosphatidylinositol alpha-1,6-mannosyltransferase
MINRLYWKNHKGRSKVCIASMAPFVGGAEVAAERLALGLREAGLDVFLLLGRAGAVQERLEKSGLRYIVSPMHSTDKWHPLRYWKARRALTRILRLERPSLVHSNDLPTHQIISHAAGRLAIPRICHHRFPFPGTAIDWLNKYGAEHHLFVSRALMEEMCVESSRLKMASRAVVYDGLPLPALPDASRRAQARQGVGLRADRTIVTIAGQVIERKGVADLIGAWSLLSPSVRDGAELVVVGDDLAGEGAYRRQMEALAAELKVPALFVGFQKNVCDWLTASDVAVVPSHLEPLGNATLEAMSLALPVIGTQVGGIPEMVVHETSGLLVPPRDPQTLAQALTCLVTNESLRRQMGEAGRRRCQELFSLSTHTESVLQEYAEVLDQKSESAGKTLLISEVFPPMTGGSGRWLWELYRRLPRQHFLVAAGEHPRQSAFDSTHNLRLSRLPLTFSSWGIPSWSELPGYGRAILALRRLVRAENVRMIHVARCLPEGLIALVLRWLTGARFGCYVHGEEMSLATTSREITWLMRRVICGSDFFIANSRNTAGILESDWGISPDRIHVLHPGVDTARFVPAARDRGVRAELGWGERPVVLTVGRLQKRKGQDLMIQALTQVRNAIPGVLYSIVGHGEELQALQDLVSREQLSEHVQFLGEVDDSIMVRCYQQCDLFALPNRQVGKDFEGFGMVLVEAQACGRPVLAGASGGTAETMRAPGTGRIVSCESPKQLSAAVIELLSDQDKLDQMGAAGRRWVVDHLDWTPLSRQAQELFARIQCGQPDRERGCVDGPGSLPGVIDNGRHHVRPELSSNGKSR